MELGASPIILIA